LGELDKKVKTAEDRKEYNQSVFGIEKKQMWNGVPHFMKR